MKKLTLEEAKQFNGELQPDYSYMNGYNICVDEANKELLELSQEAGKWKEAWQNLWASKMTMRFSEIKIPSEEFVKKYMDELNKTQSQAKPRPDWTLTDVICQLQEQAEMIAQLTTRFNEAIVNSAERRKTLIKSGDRVMFLGRTDEIIKI